jgi:hypothetical protein
MMNQFAFHWFPDKFTFLFFHSINYQLITVLFRRFLCIWHLYQQWFIHIVKMNSLLCMKKSWQNIWIMKIGY